VPEGFDVMIGRRHRDVESIFVEAPCDGCRDCSATTDREGTALAEVVLDVDDDQCGHHASTIRTG
jgi:hypothetical protein